MRCAADLVARVDARRIRETAMSLIEQRPLPGDHQRIGDRAGAELDPEAVVAAGLGAREAQRRRRPGRSPRSAAVPTNACSASRARHGRVASAAERDPRVAHRVALHLARPTAAEASAKA